MGRRRALVVDDHADVREMMAHILAEAGYSVQVAKTGLEAFEKIARTGAPHVVVLDLLMPVMGGIALRHHLREFNSLARVPVVGVSACEWGLETAREFDAFLPKPFEAAQLVGAVEFAMLRARERGA